MTDQHSLGEPPRRALRVRVPAGGQGHDGLLDHWRDVWPGDPDYEAVYQQALHAFRVAGTPMPYADAQDRQDIGGTVGE